MNKFIIVLFTLLLFLKSTDVKAACFSTNDCIHHEANELILIPKSRISNTRLDKVLLKRNLHFRKSITVREGEILFNIFKAPEDYDVNELADNLRKTGLFTLVEPNYTLHSDYVVVSSPVKKLIPSDEAFKKQYYLEQTKITSSWIYSMGSPSFPIAVLDSGIDYSYIDLNERISLCSVVIDDGYSCEDEFGHGTKVASILGSQVDNKLLLAGITWLNPILPIKVSNELGIARVSTIIRGLEEAIKNNAKIVTISLSTDKYSEALRLAVEAANKKGILIISSGGNTGVEEVRYPAAFENVVGVGSVDSETKRSNFSTVGSHIKIVAPGEGIVVPSLNSNLTELVDGNSFSVPQVAGIAALVWAVRPNFTSKDIKNILFSTALDLGEEGFDKEYGYGQIDALKAVQKALANIKK